MVFVVRSLWKVLPVNFHLVLLFAAEFWHETQILFVLIVAGGFRHQYVAESNLTFGAFLSY